MTRFIVVCGSQSLESNDASRRTGKRANMSRQANLSEHEKNLKAYSMPHHGIPLEFFFSM